MSYIGEVVIKERKVPICKLCNCVVGDLPGTNSCSYSCAADMSQRTSDNTVIHVWKRTEEYLRNEEYAEPQP